MPLAPRDALDRLSEAELLMNPGFIMLLPGEMLRHQFDAEAKTIRTDVVRFINEEEPIPGASPDTDP